jgi:septin family protein
MTPVSLHDNDQKIHDMPYTIFSPDIGTTTTRAAMIRQYPWGTADVMDPRQSDFVALRSAILGGYAGVSRPLPLT